MINIFTDRIFRIARLWSNEELRKFASLFSGEIVNVSGWQDSDKEGSFYKNYFCNADNYHITNFKAEARGLQGFDNEIFLDLEEDLNSELIGKYDVVFNHTVLEHIYNTRKAFSNLCLLSKDVVIVVVPFLQQMHADYGDYWRFTPLTMKKLFQDNNMELQYLSFNSHSNASVYLFCIGVKNKKKWDKIIPEKFSYEEKNSYNGSENFVGSHAISNKIHLIPHLIKRYLKI